MDIGVIPDGNRRYARAQEIEKYEAYEQARDTIKNVTESLEGFSDDLESITFYLLSEENLKRKEGDLKTLFQLLKENVKNLSKFFEGKNFSVNWLTTNPDPLPAELVKKLKSLEKEFTDGDIDVNLLISYSGKEDILEASEELAQNGGKFTEENLQSHLQINNDIDFVIRTGDNPDRECLSGFPIWNSSYAEFYHIKKNFPAVKSEDVKQALDHYQSLRRKKGK